MDDPDMLAAMGFSSFGGAKKRKFDQTSSPKAKADASGANSTRLGVRPKKTPQADGQELQATDEDAVAADAAAQDTQSQPSPPPTAKGKKIQPAATGLAAFLARGQEIQDPPSEAQQSAPAVTQSDQSETVSFGGLPITQAELNALRHGIRNEEGDLAYFLTSFVEDPWERLEAARK